MLSSIRYYLTELYIECVRNGKINTFTFYFSPMHGTAFPPHLMMHSKFPDCAMRHTADQSGGVTDFGITHASFMLTSSNFSCILKQVYWLKSVHRICKSECAIYSRILEVFDGKSQKCYKKKCRSIV